MHKWAFQGLAIVSHSQNWMKGASEVNGITIYGILDRDKLQLFSFYNMCPLLIHTLLWMC